MLFDNSKNHKLNTQRCDTFCGGMTNGLLLLECHHVSSMYALSGGKWSMTGKGGPFFSFVAKPAVVVMLPNNDITPTLENALSDLDSIVGQSLFFQDQ